MIIRRTISLLCGVLLAAALPLSAHAKVVDAPAGEMPDAVTITFMETEQVTDEAGLVYLNTDYVMSESLRPLLEQAIALFENKNRDVSFVMIDILSGAGVCYKPNRPCYSASAIKAPYIFSILSTGVMPTQAMFSAGHHSDNAAYSSLRRTYGTQGLAAYMDAAGVNPLKSRYNYPWDITSLDLCKMWYLAYRTLFINEALTEWIYSAFTGSNNSSMAAVLGESYLVTSKAGWITYASRNASVYNDAGIIDNGVAPYLLAVTARGPDGIGRQNADVLIPVLNMIHNEMTMIVQSEEK